MSKLADVASTTAGRLARAARQLKRVLAAISIVVVAAGMIWAIIYLPQYLVSARHLKLSPTDRLSSESDIRSSLLQLVGGVVLIIGLYFTARGFLLTRQGHITDRYAKAVEQLGNGSSDIRIGGIFSLERIARDSVDDRQNIAELLTAFVREHTRAGPQAPSQSAVPADVQAALTVLGRRVVDTSSPRLNFYHSGLSHADLSGSDMRRAMFLYGDLTHTSFAGARIDGADLSFCHASGAAFTAASARGCGFVNATYINGWFLNADLTDTDFYGCDLSGSDFGRRYAEEGDPPFPPAILRDSRFTQANLTGTILKGVDLRTVKGLQPDQLAAAVTDENTVPPEFWGGGDDSWA